MAIFPISVSIPVAVTTATAVPYVMLQPEKTMLLLSPSGASAFGQALASFSAGTDSPVSADSSLFKLTLCKSLASAGTKSPASKRMISPGTNSDASMIDSALSRRTRACGADIFFNASSALSARLSCITPIMAFTTTISKISNGSKKPSGSPSTHATTKETAAAASNIRIITSLNCSANLSQLLFDFFARNRFSPYCSRRFFTSDDESPVASCTLSSCKTSCFSLL